MNRSRWIAPGLFLALSGIVVEPLRAQGGFSDSGTSEASPREGSPPSGTNRPDSAVVGNHSPGMRAPVAMLGYSPVSLLNTRQWVKGRDQFKATYDGATYLLADGREMQTFRVAPEQYLPALGGDCVVHFVNTGERKPGLLRHGVVHEGRLYFLSSSENRQAFVENPERYMDADLALDGNCPVCLVELNKAIPGQEELALILGGFRYVFPGAQQREMFRAQPMRYAAAAHAIAGQRLPGGASLAGVVPEPLATSGLAPERGGTGEPAADDAAPAAAELPPPVPTALGGYCPVAILRENRWVRGQPESALVFDGRRYLFASPEERQLFQENPTAFVPALGGDCVVTFQERGDRVEGSLFHAVIHRGRQYLFADRRQKEKFKESPDAFADIDLALSGQCAVRLVDSGDRVEGNPEFTAWHNGFRYQLSGREEFERFQADPQKYARTASEPSQGTAAGTTEPSDNPFD